MSTLDKIVGEPVRAKVIFVMGFRKALICCQSVNEGSCDVVDIELVRVLRENCDYTNKKLVCSCQVKLIKVLRKIRTICNKLVCSY